MVGVALAAPELYGHGGGDGGHHDYYAYPKYKYSYGVNDKHTGDHKSAYEYRDGKVTKGSYSVLQPDGILRTVNYVVSPKGGFQAEVINKGVAKHAPVHGKGHDYGHGHGNYVTVSHHGGYGNGLGGGDLGGLGDGGAGLGGGGGFDGQF
jgi:hypothetical protein